MSKYKIGGKEALVEGVTIARLERPPTVINFGSLSPTEIKSQAKVGGKSVLKGPLAFTMAACSPAGANPGSCNGGGVIVSAQSIGKDKFVPFLVVGDQGNCFGICQVGPAVRPQVCMLKIAKSGQEANGSAEDLAPGTVAPPESTEPPAALDGAVVALLGPDFQALKGFEYLEPKTGEWKEINNSIYLSPQDIDQCGGRLKVREKKYAAEQQESPDH